jgi:hypothetical protein
MQTFLVYLFGVNSKIETRSAASMQIDQEGKNREPASVGHERHRRVAFITLQYYTRRSMTKSIRPRK